jgi:5-methylcytosine-specific restriction enzyme A
MPSRPKRPCSYPSCSNLTEERYCEQHKPQEHNRYDNNRGTAAQRGYDHRWRKARLVFLRKNPLCVRCLEERKLTSATVVDYIVLHKGNYELFCGEPCLSLFAYGVRSSLGSVPGVTTRILSKIDNKEVKESCTGLTVGFLSLCPHTTVYSHVD